MLRYDGMQVEKKSPYIKNLFAVLIAMTVLGNFIDLYTEGWLFSKSW